MIKIEDTPMSPVSKRTGADYRDFLRAVKALEKDQSFITKLSARDRVALTVAGLLLDRHYITRREGTQFRVGRVL